MGDDKSRLELLGTRAEAWASFWREARDLKAERAACLCEEQGRDTDEDGRLVLSGYPCWMGDPDEPDFGGHMRPDAGWCATCRQRYEIHGRYRKAVASRQAALRGILRAVHGKNVRLREVCTGGERGIRLRKGG